MKADQSKRRWALSLSLRLAYEPMLKRWWKLRFEAKPSWWSDEAL